MRLRHSSTGHTGTRHTGTIGPPTDRTGVAGEQDHRAGADRPSLCPALPGDRRRAHRRRDRSKIVRAAHVGRHRVDEVAERAQPHALLARPPASPPPRRRGGRAGRRRSRRAPARRPPRAARARARAPCAARPRSPGPRRASPRSLQQPDRGERDGAASGLPMNVGPCISTPDLAVARSRRRPRGGAQRGGQRQVAAGQRLADAHDVRRDARVLGGEERARCGRTRWRSRRRPAARRAVGTARAARAGSAGSWKRMPPAPCTTGSTITAASSSACVSTSRASSRDVVLLERGRRRSGEHLPRQHAAPQRVHAAVRVADAHRAEGVAVVAAAPGQQPVLGRASARPLVLQAHLDRDLDRHRAGVGEEDVLEPGRGDVDEPPGQLDGRARG